MIEIRHLQKAYAGRPVLDGLSLTIERGRTLGVIGPGGCGKTVLLKLIAGLEVPEAGHIVVDGREITGMTEAQLVDERAKMGMLFQNYALFDSMTVADNVAFPLLRGNPLDAATLALVSEKLGQVGLAGSERLLPRELSGGMKKRVGLARALIAKPPYLLLDEPSAGLDPVSTRTVNDLIVKLREEEGFTALVSSYDFDAIRDIVDNVVLLDGGRAVFYGTPQDIDGSVEPIVRHFIDGIEVEAV